MGSQRPASRSIARCCPISRSASRRHSRPSSSRPRPRCRRKPQRRPSTPDRSGTFVEAVLLPTRAEMIDPAYVRRMARYNRWQNQNLYGVAETLSDEERRRERGAFFGSIHKTLSHLLWGDRIWMSRFMGGPRPQGGIPESVSMYPDWDGLKRER